MKALKCYVCGKLYEYGENNGCAQIGKYTKENPNELKHRKFFDICPECFEKVKQVLRIIDESKGKTV